MAELILADIPAELRTEEEDAEFLSAELERSFDENLADFLDERELSKIATETIYDYEQDEASRKDWLYRERHGIRLLGISENVVDSAPFEGASQATYPGLIEAVIQFQSRALAELWPPEGPVKVLALDKANLDHDAQSYRVQQYMNYLYTERMPGAFEEQDKLLFRIPLSGSAFVKVCFDPLENTIVRKFIPTDDFVVPYEASDLRSTPRWTHVLRYTTNDLKRLQEIGFYREVELRPSSDDRAGQTRILKDEVDATESRDRSTTGTEAVPNLIYEQLRYLTLEDDEIASPYIVHVDKENQQTLAIRRNWEEGDPARKPNQFITHYKFLPGLGFYGYGYLHILSGLAHAQTGALRALLDSAQFANLQGGFVSKDIRLGEDEIPVSPGQWIRVEAVSEEIAKAFFPLPFKEPSGTLFNLHQFLDDVFRRTAGTTEVTVGDAPNNAPVGTTLALIEQSQRVQTAVHIRLHHAAKSEFRIVQQLVSKHFDSIEGEVGSYVELVDPNLTAEDFDGRVDVIPVSDPNVISAAQRIAMAQAVLQLSQQAPDIYNKSVVHRNLLEAMRIPNVQDLLVDPTNIAPMDPVSENIALTNNQPVKAYMEQDHDAHLLVLESWYNMLDPETRRQTQGAYYAHRAEHVAYRYQIQIMNSMGISEIPQDMTPEDQNLLAAMAAQAAQLMAQEVPQEQDPKLLESQAKMDLKAQETISDIRRKDTETAARIKREDAVAIAKQSRDIQKQEADMLKEAISDDLQQAAELQT